MQRRLLTIATCCTAAFSVVGCSQPRNQNLLDGCYYLGNQLILSIRGTAGTLVIPGDVSGFQLIPQGSTDHIWMTTQPNFEINGSGRRRAKLVKDPLSPSPVIIIDDLGSMSARILIRDNDAVARLVHQDSCPAARSPLPVLAAR